MQTSLHDLVKQIEDSNLLKLMQLVEVNIHQIQERSLAQSMVISWMLSRYPAGEGLAFLRAQLNNLTGEQANHELIAGFEELQDFLLSINGSAPPQVAGEEEK